MSKYKIGQILRVLGGFRAGCIGTGDDSIGKLFEVITDKDTTPYDKIAGFVPTLHEKEEYVLLRNLKTNDIICLNSDFEAEVVESSISEEDSCYSSYNIGEEVVVIDKSVLSAYEIGDVVKILEIRIFDDEKIYVEVRRHGDDYTQTIALSDIRKVKQTILTINDDNEVTYYEDGTEVRMKIKEDDLKAFLKKLKPTVPHLESLYDGVSIGVIGESTKLKDSLDAQLFVGDIVDTYRNGFKIGTCAIAKKEQYGAFVYGWATNMSELAMETNEFNEDVRLRKVKDFEELENGYEIDGVIVIREEK